MLILWRWPEVGVGGVGVGGGGGGLNMGCGGAVGEDAGISDDAGLCGGGEDGLVGGGARWWVCYRFPRVCVALGRPPKKSPILFPFPPQCVFGQSGKEK